MKYLSFKYKETVDSPKACFAISKSDSSTNLKMQVQTIITVLISLTDFWLENDEMLINDHCWQKKQKQQNYQGQVGAGNWRSGESVCLPPMWPSLIPGPLVMTGLSLLVLRFSAFPKNQHLIWIDLIVGDLI